MDLDGLVGINRRWKLGKGRVWETGRREILGGGGQKLGNALQINLTTNKTILKTKKLENWRTKQ